MLAFGDGMWPQAGVDQAKIDYAMKERKERERRNVTLYPWLVPDEIPNGIFTAKAIGYPLTVSTSDATVLECAKRFAEARNLDNRAIDGDLLVNALTDLLDKAMRKQHNQPPHTGA